MAIVKKNKEAGTYLRPEPGVGVLEPAGSGGPFQNELEIIPLFFKTESI